MTPSRAQQLAAEITREVVQLVAVQVTAIVRSFAPSHRACTPDDLAQLAHLMHERHMSWIVRVANEIAAELDENRTPTSPYDAATISAPTGSRLGDGATIPPPAAYPPDGAFTERPTKRSRRPPR